MKKSILILLVTTYSLTTFSQKEYDFENPWKAKSNERVLEWFLDNLDPTSDTLLLNLFDDLGVNTDSIQWIYPSDVFYTLHNNGWDYYSRKVYFVDNKDKKAITNQKNISENKLANSLFNLSYFYQDGVTTLVLVEYY
jgi:hypothetical protein